MDINSLLYLHIFVFSKEAKNNQKKKSATTTYLSTTCLSTNNSQKKQYQTYSNGVSLLDVNNEDGVPKLIY